MARFRLETTSFKDGLASLKPGFLKPVHFLMGEDQFLQQHFVETLTKFLFGEEMVQKMVLIPDEMSSKDILDQLTAADLFSAKKLFLLRNPNALKGKARDEFVEYCQRPTDGHTLVIMHDEFGAKNKFMESLVKSVKPVSCSTPFESGMIQWANSFFTKNGINHVSPEIIKSLIEIAGDSLNHLKNEIDKIAISAGSSSEITKKEIEKFSGWKRKFRQYEFFHFLGQRKLKESMELGRALVSQDTSMINLLYPLTEFFQELLFLKISKGTNGAFKGFTRLSHSVNKQLPVYANQYTSDEITLALKRLAQIDQQLKTSRIKDESAITEFVYATLGNG
ncbi:MAG: DNA polymerase III subunit delta [Candidatus Marinimicrobia bacterium]|jgi:DNA polymerase III delta subunit|nr:DNA polymerase III subunit delta [Candidatus Neomarinimicrobiota bacterium]MDP6611788.1 DNA polymerase III subunit delta [Candidatus Neomarinimicrobiota bacterium]|tara:strand:+ start:21751 stop:22758 length:1008 start_codon:yes stop_codon:yes gene_type:complete